MRTLRNSAGGEHCAGASGTYDRFRGWVW